MTKRKMSHYALLNCKPLKNFLSHFADITVQIQFLISGRKIFVTWPDGPKFGTPLVDTCIVGKFQLSTSSGFGIIRKKVKTWTHLPEKLLSKNEGTTRARDVPAKLTKCQSTLAKLVMLCVEKVIIQHDRSLILRCVVENVVAVCESQQLIDLSLQSIFLFTIVFIS